MACLVLPQGKAFKDFRRGTFAGDDKFSVDRLVESCQPKTMQPLTSAGRDLVPYFTSPEDCVNETLNESKSDLTRNRKKSAKKSPKTSTDIGVPARENSPTKTGGKRAAHKLQELTILAKSVRSKHPASADMRRAAFATANSPQPLVPNDLKAWAGPSYYTSPPPENLPMPTAFLLSVS